MLFPLPDFLGEEYPPLQDQIPVSFLHKVHTQPPHSSRGAGHAVLWARTTQEAEGGTCAIPHRGFSLDNGAHRSTQRTHAGCLSSTRFSFSFIGASQIVHLCE